MSKLDDILFNPRVLPDDMKKQQVKALMLGIGKELARNRGLGDLTIDLDAYNESVNNL